MTRTEYTLKFLKTNPQVFDRITRNKQGGRVGWAQRRPVSYDSKAGFPWSDVRGRYWYPWRKS